MSARDYDWRRVGRATNWHPRGEIKHEKQPFMFGEGVGNCLGLEGPKHTLDVKTQEAIEQGNREYAAELAAERKERRRREKDQRKSFQEVLASREASGAVLVDQRIFYTQWSRKDWEKRSALRGGLPEGVDVAYTEFGLLLMVPVIEADTAAKLGIDKKVPGEKQRRDSFGRPYWVQAEIKDFLSLVFGAIDWARPLSISEAKQFGVQIQ